MTDLNQLDFEKGGGLIPAIVQDAVSGQVLMLGYMNEEAVRVTRDSGKVTFYSRSRSELWTKGETSGHFLHFVAMATDCDHDALLVTANPVGPTCHLGVTSCFGEPTRHALGCLGELQQVVDARKGADPESSYTASLFHRGSKRIAQKVGEEGVETALAAVGGDTDELQAEAADLLYHLTVLLSDAGLNLGQVSDLLRERHQPS
ncbi:MAG: bifunctional phosphoribosyl-AMP cyclohydrolase/phosphoribosyl-ATP diphosphatase HisIE [Pseudomonadota bacterium]